MPGTPPEGGVPGASELDARAISAGSSRCVGAAALLFKGKSFWPLVSGILYFWFDPKFMAIGEGRNVD